MTGHCSKPTWEASHPSQNKSQSLCNDHKTLRDLTPLSLWQWHLLSLSLSHFCSDHTSLHTPSIILSHTLCICFSSTWKPIWKRRHFFLVSARKTSERALLTILHKIILPSDPCPPSFLISPLPCFAFITLITIYYTLIGWCIIGILAWVYWYIIFTSPVRRHSMGQVLWLVHCHVLAWHRVNSPWVLSGKN